jgi:hypothetical protein
MRPPKVSAGPNQRIMLPNAATIVGIASDDGFPPVARCFGYNVGPSEWPRPITFENPHSLSTAVTFSALGSYVPRLTASDGVVASPGVTAPEPPHAE